VQHLIKAGHLTVDELAHEITIDERRLQKIDPYFDFNHWLQERPDCAMTNLHDLGIIAYADDIFYATDATTAYAMSAIDDLDRACVADLAGLRKILKAIQ
jgi:hypothetical protein